MLIAGATAVVSAIGPVLGTAVILLTDLPFRVDNVVAGTVYAVLYPLRCSITVTYIYFDALVREQLEHQTPPQEVLPEEVPSTT